MVGIGWEWLGAIGSGWERLGVSAASSLAQRRGWECLGAIIFHEDSQGVMGLHGAAELAQLIVSNRFVGYPRSSSSWPPTRRHYSAHTHGSNMPQTKLKVRVRSSAAVSLIPRKKIRRQLCATCQLLPTCDIVQKIWSCIAESCAERNGVHIR